MLGDLIATYGMSPDVALDWKPFRVTAGRATYELNRIELSSKLLHDFERVERTLKHEFAHLLAFRRFGRLGMGHGRAWKEAMADLGEEPIVRHAYECQRNAKPAGVVYECLKCRTRFHRVRKLPKRRKYLHARCGGPLRLVEELSGASSRNDELDRR